MLRAEAGGRRGEEAESASEWQEGRGAGRRKRERERKRKKGEQRDDGERIATEEEGYRRQSLP